MPDGSALAVRPTRSREGGADMEYTMQLVLAPGAHASGVDVSTAPRSWQRTRRCSLAIGDVPTVNGTGVSAGGCRT
jgi:hypothetical protein